MVILVLTDRDWSHPEAGGTGTTLRALVTRWLDAGHRVTLIAGSYDGATTFECPHPRLEIHRMGTRLTVFPRAAWAHRRGLANDADVVFEVVNGIAFFTPLWRSLRAPTVVLLQHVHQEHYVAELGWLGRIGALLLERLPLAYLYRRASFLTISDAARRELIELGVRRDSISVVYLGVEPATSEVAKAPSPRLLYLGRLKRYKRLELLLDVLSANPDAILDIAGEGDYRAALEAEIDRRGLGRRVVLHGFVSESNKPDLYSRAWLNLTTSCAEGWGLSVMEAAACGTPSAALRVGGLCEAIVDGETGILAGDSTELGERVGQVLASPRFRDRLGSTAAERARRFSWDTAADNTLDLLCGAAANGRRPLRLEPVIGEQRPHTLPAPKVAGAWVATDVAHFRLMLVLGRLLGWRWRS